MKKIVIIALTLAMLCPSLSFADAWMNSIAKYSVADVDYQDSGNICFHLTGYSNKLFIHSFTPSTENELSRAKIMHATLVLALTTGKLVSIMIPGDNPTVNLTDSVWQNFTGIRISQ